MQNVNLLIKPASSQCNMRCGYCFYRDVSSMRTVPDCGMMDLETAERLISAAFQAADRGGSVSFSFQGGEPTLAGLDFYRSFLNMEKELDRPDLHVYHAIQTNGLQIDEAWAVFLAQNHFLVGISLDGNKALHDAQRIDSEGKGTWDPAVSALSLLQKHKVEVNALCVVTARCTRASARVYHNLKKLGLSYLQFVPCLDPLEGPRGASPYSLSSDAYGKFLCQLFDAWYRDWRRGEYVSVRLFDDYVRLTMGVPARGCAVTGQCGGCLICEADGGLYPCDFYVLDQWHLGKIGERPLAEVYTSATAQAFLAEGEILPEGCDGCRWRRLCQGGCRRDWIPRGQGVENSYCASFRQFFAHAEARLIELARAELLLQAEKLY